MTTLYAQPYYISATGFFFESADDYDAKSKKAVNDFGQPVEEFEIQFIDGEQIDCELAQAIRVHQGNFAAFLDDCEELDEHDKCILIIAVGECGHTYEPGVTSPRSFDVDFYEMDSLREFAEHFIQEGLMGRGHRTALQLRAVFDDAYH